MFRLSDSKRNYINFAESFSLSCFWSQTSWLQKCPPSSFLLCDWNHNLLAALVMRLCVCVRWIPATRVHSNHRLSPQLRILQLKSANRTIPLPHPWQASRLFSRPRWTAAWEEVVRGLGGVQMQVHPSYHGLSPAALKTRTPSAPTPTPQPPRTSPQELSQGWGMRMEGGPDRKWRRKHESTSLPRQTTPPLDIADHQSFAPATRHKTFI